jgi:HK97 family phage portal protein
MGFLGLLRRKGLFGITWGLPGAQTWEGAREFNLGLELGGSSEKLSDPYAKHSTVATAVSIFAGDAASVGWEMFPEGNDDDEIESHPILQLLEKPSPGMDGFQLRVGTYLSLKLFGEAFWYYPDVELGSKGGLRATSQPSGTISLLDPRSVSVDLTGRTPVWKLRVRGVSDVNLDETRLTQFRRANPYNPMRGLSEIESVLIEIETDHAAAMYNRAFFRDQKGIPAGMFLPSETMQSSPQEREDFTKRFNADAASSRRRISTAPPGWKWQDIGVSMKDMEFRSLREYDRELILAAIGVPPFMAGVLDKANYANAREQREAYWLGPQTRFLTYVQSVLNSDFLPKLGAAGVRLYPCWEQVKALVENLSQKVDIAQKLFAMGFPKRHINDRLELGMDVEDLEDADVGYLAFNVVPVSQVLDPPQPAALPPTKPAETDGLPPETLAFSEDQEKRRALVWRGIMARTLDLEKRFDQMIRRHLREIEDAVLENVNGIKGWRATQTKATELDLMFDMHDMKLRLSAQAAPLQRSALTRGGESVMSDLSIAQDFDAGNLRVQAKLAELSGKIQRIDSTVEAALRESLREGLHAGENVSQLAARVRSVMDASKARSMTIARTETGFAYNTGRYEGMKQAGVQRQEWLTARDSRVRDSHASPGVDGQVVAIGEPFKMGSGVSLLYPLDPSGPPGEIINCRCVAIPVIAEAS